MASDTLHAPRERLSTETLSMHHAIVSLMEELEAVDWYRQRADGTILGFAALSPVPDT